MFSFPRQNNNAINKLMTFRHVFSPSGIKDAT